MIKFLKDSLSIFESYKLQFIEKHKEHEGVYTFIFEKDANLDWKPGQHGIFFMKNLGIKNVVRPFSISSIPKENKVMITTQFKGEPSKFKKALLSLEAGDLVSMRGPVGLLSAVENKPQVFIAAGMGITPYRSMIKSLETTSKTLEQVQLIYLSSQNQHVYKKDWTAMTAQSRMKVNLVSERQEMVDEVKKAIKDHQNEAYYYLVGPSSMVSSMKKIMQDEGIDKKNIKRETFFGY